MSEQTRKLPAQATLASFEADFFGAISGFHTKIMTLLRQSSLDDEKINVVGDRIKTLLVEITADMEKAQWCNYTEQLEAAYDVMKRLVDELSATTAGGKDR